MRVKLGQSVSFEGKSYGLGVHEMPDPLFGHWYFKKLMAAGMAAVEGEPPAEAPPADPVVSDKDVAKSVLAAAVPEVQSVPVAPLAEDSLEPPAAVRRRSRTRKEPDGQDSVPS